MTEADLRALIHEAAGRVPEIGPLEESVKWGEPSFAPRKPGVGSSVRIAAGKDDGMALMFICHTNLIEEFRMLYPDRLAYQGNRAILIPAGQEPDRDALLHCIALALTYKLRKRGKPVSV